MTDELKHIQPTSITGEYIRNWIDATQSLERAKCRVASADVELSNATKAAGKHLVPEDAVIGEKFHIWYGDGLLTVIKTEQNTYKLEWRKQPSKESLIR